jgi:hypothetical protein
MKRFRVFIAASALLVGGCSSLSFKPTIDFSPFTAGYRDTVVRLKPKDDGTIELPTNSRCKQGANKDGCLAFPAGTYGLISFSVSAPGHENKACGDPGVKWVITRIQIADSGDIATGKSTDFDKPVDAATRSALHPFKDPSTGTIYEETWAEGSTTVQVLNRNDNAPSTTKDLWYRVEATRCAEPHTLAKTDPRIENYGR